MQHGANADWADALAAIPTGAHQRRDLETHDHAALVYWSQEEFLDTIVPYIVDGLRGGDFVVHVAHAQPMGPVKEALALAGIDVDAATAEGRLLMLTAGQAFSPEGRFDQAVTDQGIRDMIDAAQARGARQVRFSVDMSYVLSGTPGVDEVIAFDARANEDIFPNYPFVCICSYNAASGASELVEDIFVTHPLVFVRGIPLPNPYYKPWQEVSRQRTYLQRWKERYTGGLIVGQA